MNLKENVILVKGFKLKEGHVFCRDYDFGNIDEIEGKTFTLDCKDEELKLCNIGFHACDCIGKTDSFYSIYNQDHVFFKIFVKEAYFEDSEKYVFRSFTIKERYDVNDIMVKSDINNNNICSNNVGTWNTGNWNTGNCNTGSRNMGDKNVGYENTGCCNIGDKNNGNFNIGEKNNGNFNTGNRNTGNYNVGDYNTGNNNTGEWNTGKWNTGDRNLTNFSSGFFAIEESKAYCFGKPTEYTHEEFRTKFAKIIYDEPNFDALMQLPNADKDIVEQYLAQYEDLKKMNK